MKYDLFAKIILDAQCENLRIFLSLRFYAITIVWILGVKKSAILQFLEAMSFIFIFFLFFFRNFNAALKNGTNSVNSKFSSLKIDKIAVFVLHFYTPHQN